MDFDKASSGYTELGSTYTEGRFGGFEPSPRPELLRLQQLVHEIENTASEEIHRGTQLALMKDTLVAVSKLKQEMKLALSPDEVNVFFNQIIRIVRSHVTDLTTIQAIADDIAKVPLGRRLELPAGK